jgi:large subunit ribosomal protein L4
MNKKERRKALFCVLSSKLKNKQLVIVDKIDFKEAKTKNMVEVFKNIPYEKNALIAIPSKNDVIEKTSANIPYVKSVLVNYLNIKDLLKYNTLVLLKDSLGNLDSLAK